jgi:very-short-patch-repair endonuclease
MLPYNRRLKPNARRLRSHMTDSEQVLWSRLRRKQLLGVQFYRQTPIGNYVVDFYAPLAKLVVEVDGSQHLQGEQLAADAKRDAYLASQGLMVLRFDNLQVLREIEAVMEVIFGVIEERVGKNERT